MTTPLNFPSRAQGDTNGWDVPLKADLTAVRDRADSALASAGTAQTRADQAYALAAAGGGGGSSTPLSVSFPRMLMIDSFLQGSETRATVTDDLLLDRATAYAAVQTIVPAIVIGTKPDSIAGGLETYTKSRPTYQGMKIVGSPAMGWPMPQLSSSKYSINRIRVNCGTGNASWWNGSGTQYGGYFAYLSCESTNQNTQFFNYPLSLGTAYCWGFHTMGFQGFKHVFGQPTASCAITAWTISGSWTITTPLDTQCTFGGSDSDLWTDGSCNIGAGGTDVAPFYGNGKPLMIFSSLGKSNVGGIFFTADGGWRAFQVLGTPSFGPGLYMSNMRIEGRNKDDPSLGSLVEVKSGQVMIRDSSYNFGMANPAAHPDGPDLAIVEVTGGVCRIDGATYARATGVAETVPFMRVSGGKGSVANVDVNAIGGAWTGLPQVFQASNGMLRKDDTCSWASGSATG